MVRKEVDRKNIPLQISFSLVVSTLVYLFCYMFFRDSLGFLFSGESASKAFVPERVAWPMLMYPTQDKGRKRSGDGTTFLIKILPL